MHTLVDTFGFELHPGVMEERYLVFEVTFDLNNSAVNTLARGAEDSSGIDIDELVLLDQVHRDELERGDGVDGIAEELHADDIISVGEGYIDSIALDAEPATREFEVVAYILRRNECLEKLIHPDCLVATDRDTVEREVLRTADAVQAADGRDDDHILASGEQRGCGGEAQTVDLLIDAQVFLDIRVGGGDIRLGLVVVVVTDEVLDSVMREERAHLGVELCGEGLVMREDQRRPVELGDDIGYGEGLAATGNAEQGLRPCAGADAVHQCGDGLRLVAGRSVWGLEFEHYFWPLAVGCWPLAFSFSRFLRSRSRRASPQLKSCLMTKPMPSTMFA